MSVKSLTVFCAALVFSAASPLMADEESDWLSDLKTQAPEPKRAVRSGADEPASSKDGGNLNEFGNLNESNSISLRSHAAAHLRKGHADTAVELMEKALELDPQDITGRQIYADALERKLKAQNPPPPRLFNLCVKQWYYIFRHEEYSELSKTAAAHLRELTGKNPVEWQSPRSYLSKVLRPEFGEEEPQQVR